MALIMQAAEGGADFLGIQLLLVAQVGVDLGYIMGMELLERQILEVAAALVQMLQLPEELVGMAAVDL